MKKIFLLFILCSATILAGCSNCDEACYKAKSELEAQRHQQQIEIIEAKAKLYQNEAYVNQEIVSAQKGQAKALEVRNGIEIVKFLLQ